MKKNRKFKENSKKKKTRKESRGKKEKSKKEIKIINEIPLEKRIESTERGISENEFGEFFEQPELPKVSPSLTKINAPQRIPTSLEGNLGEFSISDSKDEEENNSFKYNLMKGENKKEEAYSTLSQEYSVIQKETLKHNPHVLIKEQTFIDLNQRNIVENFPRNNIHPFSEEILRNSEKKEENYLFKSSFDKKERKPHNPFERKEIKYGDLEQ